jgi:hypothetical protein
LLANSLLFVRILLFAMATPWLARIPIRRLEKLMQISSSPWAAGGESKVDQPRVEFIVNATERICRAGRRVFTQKCMTRGLTLYFFLRRAGMDVSLVFGAGKVERKFAAHCWLVRSGMPYLETTDPGPLFVPFYTFRSRGTQSGDSLPSQEAAR